MISRVFNSHRIASIVGAFLLLTTACMVFIVNRNTPSRQDTITANWVEANGVATRAEYMKTVSLQDSAGEGHALNEQEVDWLLAFANDPRFQGERRARRQMYASGPLIFTNMRRLSSMERSRVYDFGASLLLTPSQYGIVTDTNTLAGCRILGNIGDKRAIPLLKPLLGSSDRGVRRFAANALDSFGIEIPPSDDL